MTTDKNLMVFAIVYHALGESHLLILTKFSLWSTPTMPQTIPDSCQFLEVYVCPTLGTLLDISQGFYFKQRGETMAKSGRKKTVDEKAIGQFTESGVI